MSSNIAMTPLTAPPRTRRWVDVLRHLSAENAKSQGIAIQGEAVVDKAHQLVLILDAPDRQMVDRFMQPFSKAGSVESCRPQLARWSSVEGAASGER